MTQLSLDSGGVGILTDIENNVYKIKKIGTQVWMLENLKTTRLNDNTPITLETDSAAWSLENYINRYCWYKNDSITYSQTYGALYNWYTVYTGKLCPTGWHVPTTTEWNTLSTLLGGSTVAGGKLKETGTTHWQTPNTGATDQVGFRALPGGLRDNITGFAGQAQYSYWWTATENNSFTSYLRYASYNQSSFLASGYSNKPSGLSVRCIKD